VSQWPFVRRPALLLLLLCVVTFFLGLGCPAITDADEAYYAESAREMVERGDWLTPYYNYEFRWQKPVLYYWLTAVTYLVVGIGEWSARFWSALAGIALAFVTWRIGSQQMGRDEVGWFAGAIVATCFGYFAIARMSLPDLPLAFFITVAVAAALDGRWLLAGLAAGLGFLMKGPLAVVVPALVFLPIWWRERRVRQLEPGELVKAMLIFAAVGLPWYVAMTVEHGAAYLDSFFVGDNFERFATTRFNEPRSVLFYVPVLLGGVLPWTVFLLVAIWRPFREALARRLRLSDAQWRMAIWAIVPFLFFSLSIGKQPRYILPILPPIAILGARAILDRIAAAERGDRAARRELRIATYATAALLAAVAAVLLRTQELLVWAIPGFAWAAIGALLTCVTALTVAARRGRWGGLPVLLPISAAITLLAIQSGTLIGPRPEPVEEVADMVRSHRRGGERIGAHHVFVRNLIFYTGVRQEDLFSDDRALAFMRSPERVLMVVREEDLERLEAAANVDLIELGAVRYFNYANVKLRSLVLPDPERDIQRVLVVTNRNP
jgi:4-amino-4-deoxy-L-arabinose transferase-like glycosyltransferase